MVAVPVDVREDNPIGFDYLCQGASGAHVEILVAFAIKCAAHGPDCIERV